ncbi:hypothetical protein [Methylicorpusculum sp.]|uniref:hypothetical protein n=1 Tax=Methylicorpusculum sp. TaxID=2713644 RepID=UPI00271A1418|nr:hypothetical protein [Methylicorpusculum sp.]MDO8845881.1 hypothetical protein [Methylicorpusculum sp.]
MPIFILLCLSLGYLTVNENPLVGYLILPETIYIGASLMALSGLGLLINKIPQIDWHDGFASATVLVWFADWHSEFQHDVPMFYLFPFYLALMSAFVFLVFINQRQAIDEQTLSIMHKAQHYNLLVTLAIMALSIGSLFMIEHFLIFPIAMTLFHFKYAFNRCLEK